MKTRRTYITPDTQVHQINAEELMVLVRVSGETGFEPPAKENLWSDSNYEWGNLWGGVHKAGKPVGRVNGRRRRR